MQTHTTLGKPNLPPIMPDWDAKDEDFPSPATEESITDIARRNDYQRCETIAAIATMRKNVDKVLALEEARVRVVEMEKAQHRELTKELRALANSPMIGKETQAAFFKTLMLDYLAAQERGTPDDGPGLRDVLTAAKLLNETCGLNAPTEVKNTHDITLHTFPVAQAPFKGEMPELQIIDVDTTLAGPDADDEDF